MNARLIFVLNALTKMIYAMVQTDVLRETIVKLNLCHKNVTMEGQKLITTQNECPFNSLAQNARSLTVDFIDGARSRIPPTLHFGGISTLSFEP